MIVGVIVYANEFIIIPTFYNCCVFILSVFSAPIPGSRSRNSSSDLGDDSDYFSDNYNNNRSPPQSPTNSPPAAAGGKSLAATATTTTAGATAGVAGVKKIDAARVSSPPSKRHRDKKTNAEASQLRNQLSMTDYEITRLSKSLKKKAGTMQAAENQLHLQHSQHPEQSESQLQQSIMELNADIQTLHAQIGRLTSRQQGLKDEYLALTGKCAMSHAACIDCNVHCLTYHLKDRIVNSKLLTPAIFYRHVVMTSILSRVLYIPPPTVGEPFEPSKGTRGMMERWKGARRARNDKEMNALLANTNASGE